MATYLCVKTDGSTEPRKFEAKSTADKPYLRVDSSYFPLTSQTNGTGLRIKGENATYQIVESYTTTSESTYTTQDSITTTTVTDIEALQMICRGYGKNGPASLTFSFSWTAQGSGSCYLTGLATNQTKTSLSYTLTYTQSAGYTRTRSGTLRSKTTSYSAYDSYRNTAGRPSRVSYSFKCNFSLTIPGTLSIPVSNGTVVPYQTALTSSMSYSSYTETGNTGVGTTYTWTVNNVGADYICTSEITATDTVTITVQ